MSTLHYEYIRNKHFLYILTKISKNNFNSINNNYIKIINFIFIMSKSKINRSLTHFEIFIAAEIISAEGNSIQLIPKGFKNQLTLYIEQIAKPSRLILSNKQTDANIIGYDNIEKIHLTNPLEYLFNKHIETIESRYHFSGELNLRIPKSVTFKIDDIGYKLQNNGDNIFVLIDTYDKILKKPRIYGAYPDIN